MNRQWDVKGPSQFGKLDEVPIGILIFITRKIDTDDYVLIIRRRLNGLGEVSSAMLMGPAFFDSLPAETQNEPGFCRREVPLGSSESSPHSAKELPESHRLVWP